MAKIAKVTGQEVLDSRGNPTVRVTVLLDDGSEGAASVPSGASTGKHEAHELRDGEEKRYGGKGVKKAVLNVEEKIQQALEGKEVTQQEKIDRAMLDLDGSENKSVLGANAVLGVSLAVARAAANSQNVPLYEHLRNLHNQKDENWIIPRPMMNVLNGGAHANSGLDIQEYMLIPIRVNKFSEALRVGAEVFHKLGEIIERGDRSTGVGDEGGYAPSMERNDEAFELLERALTESGYETEKDAVFGIDAAATEFYEAEQKSYFLQAPQVELTPERLIALYSEWVDKFPLKSIEDPLQEDDWEGWQAATKKLTEKGVQVVGDDLFVTNTARIRRGIEHGVANAVLIKPNQIGTLTETLEAIQLAQENGYGVVISHRSGETADTFIADLAVAVNAGQIKTGSLSRSERVEKYNRLLEIETELGEKSVYNGSWS